MSVVRGPANAWDRFWFLPEPPRLLAVVRVAAALLGLALWQTWSADLLVWFGDGGMVPSDVLPAWRAPMAVSVFDFVGDSGIRALHTAGSAVFVLLALGAATPLAAVLAALLHASILHRGPMLAGPADDVLSVILWCLVVGRSGDSLSIDALRRSRRGGHARPSWRNRTALGLLRVHASAITAAALLAQLKADVWWNGTAAWHLAARESSRLSLAGWFASSEYLTNLVTHAITLFEAGFAAGVWHPRTRRAAAIGGLVGWPIVGLLAGEPAWGAAMAVLAIACLPDDA